MMFKISQCKTGFALFLTVCLGLPHIPTASAAIYKWVDANGITHYSDERPQEDDIELTTIRYQAPGKEAVEQETDHIENKPDLKNQTTDPDNNDSEFNNQPKDIVNSIELLANNSNAEKEKPGNIKTAKQLRCEQSRINLAILSKDIPVYMDNKENYRLNWGGDTYTGKRNYLSDNDRKTALQTTEATIKDHCQNPNDKTAQDIARKKWVHAEYCSLNLAILDDLQRADIKASRRQVQRQQKLAEKYCNVDEALLLSSQPEPELFIRRKR